MLSTFQSTLLSLKYKRNNVTDYGVKLITLRMKHDSLFVGKRFSAQEGWTAVIKDMEMISKIEIKTVKKKWENLLKKYRELKTPKTGSGTENGEYTSSSWPYYDLMDSALRNHHNINPPVLVSSTPFENVECIMLNDESSFNEEIFVEDDDKYAK